jgi:hypothetical protein
MVQVQVGVEHDADALAAPARIGEMLQEWRRQWGYADGIADRIARLVVAEASVDQEP